MFKAHKGYFDIRTLEQNILFSDTTARTRETFTAKRGEKGYHGFYNRPVFAEYSAEGYLEGLEITKRDYLDLINEFSGQDKTLLILDPPYLNTNMARYKGSSFGEEDFQAVMSAIKPPFVYFSDDRSGFPQYVESLKELNPTRYQALFEGAQWYTRKAHLSYSAIYQDNMVYQFRPTGRDSE